MKHLHVGKYTATSTQSHFLSLCSFQTKTFPMPSLTVKHSPWCPHTANHALLCGVKRAKSFSCSGLSSSHPEIVAETVFKAGWLGNPVEILCDLLSNTSCSPSKRQLWIILWTHFWTKPCLILPAVTWNNVQRWRQARKLDWLDVDDK